MIEISVKVVKDLPTEKLNKWQDNVVMNIARETLDFTNSKSHFPYRTGVLHDASITQGVVGNNKSYYLGARGVTYAPHVWKMGEGTNWTNDMTLPQWYVSVFEKYKSEILQIAIKNAEGSLK